MLQQQIFKTSITGSLMHAVNTVNYLAKLTKSSCQCDHEASYYRSNEDLLLSIFIYF